MAEQPTIPFEGFALGFQCLIGHLHAKGVIDKEEFAELLDSAAETFPTREETALKSLAATLRDRRAVALSIIEGGKPYPGDDMPPAA